MMIWNTYVAQATDMDESNSFMSFIALGLDIPKGH